MRVLNECLNECRSQCLVLLGHLVKSGSDSKNDIDEAKLLSRHLKISIRYSCLDI